MLLRLRKHLFILSLLFSFSAQAELFTNSYISFELPPNWKCKLDGTEHVCISQYAKQAKEAIIILAAKEAGPSDNLPAYINHLKTVRMLPEKTGQLVPSKIIQQPKERRIADHTWIDSMQLGSEISSYYTRYLATTKEGLAILITFSAHKEHYSKYSNDFLKTVESLRVLASKELLKANNTIPVKQGTEQIGVAPVDPFIPVTAAPPEPKGSGMMDKLIGLGILVSAVGYYLWRRKKS
jgi:hypothetical protein